MKKPASFPLETFLFSWVSSSFGSLVFLQCVADRSSTSFYFLLKICHGIPNLFLKLLSQPELALKSEVFNILTITISCHCRFGPDNKTVSVMILQNRKIFFFFYPRYNMQSPYITPLHLSFLIPCVTSFQVSLKIWPISFSRHRRISFCFINNFYFVFNRIRFSLWNHDVRWQQNKLIVTDEKIKSLSQKLGMKGTLIFVENVLFLLYHWVFRVWKEKQRCSIDLSLYENYKIVVRIC